MEGTANVCRARGVVILDSKSRAFRSRSHVPLVDTLANVSDRWSFCRAGRKREGKSEGGKCFDLLSRDSRSHVLRRPTLISLLRVILHYDYSRWVRPDGFPPSRNAFPRATPAISCCNDSIFLDCDSSHVSEDIIGRKNQSKRYSSAFLLGILVRLFVRFYVFITHFSLRLLLNYFIKNYIPSFQNIQIILFKGKYIKNWIIKFLWKKKNIQQFFIRSIVSFFIFCPRILWQIRSS